MVDLIVTVIMPVYNAEKYISKSISSVIAQTFQQWELIVVDDGSIDSSAEIVKSYAAKDGRIKYLYQKNKRQSAARNLGVDNCSGKWIAFLDADDYWEPHKLEIQLEYINAIKADFFFTAGNIIDDNDNVISKYETLSGMFTGEQMYRKLYRYNVIPILSVLVKASLVKEAGNWDESELINGRCEDLDFWIRLCTLNAVFYGINERLFSYRIHPENTSGNQLIMDLGQAMVLIKNFEAKRFNDAEISKIFTPQIGYLHSRLITAGKTKEAWALAAAALKIPLSVLKIQRLCIMYLGSQALWPIKIINKFNSLYQSKRLQPDFDL